MANTSRRIMLGTMPIGGGAPVLVQSMTNTDTRDVQATSAQISRLARVGCEAVRVAVPDAAAAKALPEIIASSSIPVIADIHFDWRLAIMALEAGVAGLRINPGNIGGEEKVAKIIGAAKAHHAVLRVGVNSGSLQSELLARHHGPTPEALAESALAYARMLERYGFYDFKLSLKSSSVLNTVAAYRKAAKLCDYPLHLGVTEAGPLLRGTVKSSVAAAILLSEGIGDTLRVSLTAEPEQEVRVAYEILASLGLRSRGPEIISCPTCGRTEINIFRMVEAVEKAASSCALPIKIAVMGCVVNGPGEAREADIGLAGGRGKGIIFRKGRVIRSVTGEDALLRAFLAELDILIAEISARQGSA